jgi:hypothetical protein
MIVKNALIIKLVMSAMEKMMGYSQLLIDLNVEMSGQALILIVLELLLLTLKYLILHLLLIMYAKNVLVDIS